MHVRDASGRQVSLLNDDPSAAMSSRHPALYTTDMPVYYGRAPRGSTSPNTPELLRSDSYDSQVSATDPLSPMTPLYDYGRYASDRHVYDDYYADPFTAHAGTKRLSVATDAQSGFYEDDAAASPSAGGSGERSAKRYPCRYRETHGCEKTFTTSGHASRHSKIHTAEKAVPCSFQGCPKKFTRADNMKQHLETHYKDKSRSSTSRSSLSSSSSSGDRRSSTSGKSSSGRKSSSSGAVSGSTPLPSPGGVWDMRGLDLPIIGRPSAIRSPSSGLDALAMAVACQEGA